MRTALRKKAAPRSTDKPIEVQALADGTLGVWTTDVDPYLAEARAADDVRLAEVLADFRQRGHDRPVRVVLCNDGPHAVREHAHLRIPSAAVALNLRSDCLTGFVMTVAEARKTLRAIFGAGADQLFRNPAWPVSFWEVHVLGARTRVYETRTWKDVRAAG